MTVLMTGQSPPTIYRIIYDYFVVFLTETIKYDKITRFWAYIRLYGLRTLADSDRPQAFPEISEKLIILLET